MEGRGVVQYGMTAHSFQMIFYFIRQNEEDLRIKAVDTTHPTTMTDLKKSERKGKTLEIIKTKIKIKKAKRKGREGNALTDSSIIQQVIGEGIWFQRKSIVIQQTTATKMLD